MDTFIRFMAVILAIILLVLFPLQYIAQSQDETVEAAAHSHVHEFTETARKQGYISLDMYEELEDKLYYTGELYDLSLTVAHPVTALELNTAQANETKNNKLAPDTLSSAVTGGFKRLAAHTHTDDCYEGHRHVAACTTTHTAKTYESLIGRPSGQTAIIKAHKAAGNTLLTANCQGYCTLPEYFTIYNYIDRSDGVTVYEQGSYYMEYKTIRSSNGTVTFEFVEAQDWKDRYTPANNPGLATTLTVAGLMSLKSTYTFYNTFNSLHPSSKVNPGSDTNTYTYLSGSIDSCGAYQIIGNTHYVYTCGLVQDETPDCNRVVTSITPTNPTQTVNKGGNIITTATATYLDGHTGTVNCTSNFNLNIVGTQTVTLTYSGLVGNAKTTGTRTCIVNVTVKETNIPSYLTVTPSANTVYNGAKPTFTVVVTYTSGNTKTLAAGSYTESGWSTGPGTKNLIFTYTENSTTVTKNITITVLPNLSGVSVTPTSQSVKRYSAPAFTVTVRYENNTSKVITSGYQVIGLNNKNLGLQTATISYNENSITKSTTASVTYTKLTTTCQVCGTTYELDENDTDRGCPVCGSKVIKIVASPYRVTVNREEALPIIVTATYQNGATGKVTGWTSNYNPNVIGTRQVEIQYLGNKCTITVETLPGKVTCPICGNSYDLNPDGSDPGCPICSKTVTGITITEDSVTIERFDILPITVTAKYRDNHTAIIYDWSANFVPDRAGTYKVTVFYKDFTDTVMVKVLDDDEITCPICGTVYSRSENPGGCPVCSVTLTGIEARLRNGGTQVIYKSEIRLEITLIYRDSHQEIVFSGYSITGYHPEALGFQDIVVHYEEFTTVLKIEVIKGPARVICPRGHEYYLNEDGTDPGCPFCEGYDKDEVITYLEDTYTPEILESLIETGEYHLKKGDYLTITIIPKDASVRSRLRKMFFGTNSGMKNRRFTYGGEVY